VQRNLEQSRPLSRSFVGIPVEVMGKRWGVIVLDSNDDIRTGTQYVKLYTLISKFLAKLLEKA
jgi:hypothetical protein